MAPLWGHATDRPGRWKEPRAFAATDHTAQRAHQRRGRRTIRRRVSGECGGGCRAPGSLIPHAGAICALMIAMIQAAFRAPPMPPSGVSDRAAPAGGATPGGAIRLPAIARRANREEAMAQAAGFLAKRRVHDVGVAARFDWTRLANRGTRKTTGSVRRSIEAVTEGLELLPPGLHLTRRTAQLTRRRTISSYPKRPWTLAPLWTHRTRPQRLGNLAQNARFPRAPTAIVFS